MAEHDFSIYGIPEAVNLFGSVTSIFAVMNPPIVFLMSENHDSPQCIEQNIADAVELLAKANVTLVGVESHQGGCEWNDYDGTYYSDRFNPGTDPNPVNAHPEFAGSAQCS